MLRHHRHLRESVEYPFDPIDDGSLIVVHPDCDRPILILEIVLTHSNPTLRIEGICSHCDRYVRLEYTPSRLPLRKVRES